MVCFSSLSWTRTALISVHLEMKLTGFPVNAKENYPLSILLGPPYITSGNLPLWFYIVFRVAISLFLPHTECYVYAQKVNFSFLLPHVCCVLYVIVTHLSNTSIDFFLFLFFSCHASVNTILIVLLSLAPELLKCRGPPELPWAS